jgi:hypothetical protein
MKTFKFLILNLYYQGMVMPDIFNFRDNMPSFRGSDAIYIFMIFMSSLFKLTSNICKFEDKVS